MLVLKQDSGSFEMHLEPFQLDDSKSLHEKWLEITKHPLKTGCLEFQAFPNWVNFCQNPSTTSPTRGFRG